jgi:hypothetical protein
MAEAYQLYGLYLLAALVALVLVLGVWLVVLQGRLNRLVAHYDRLTGDVTDGTLRDAFERYVERLDEATGQVEDLTRLCNTVEDQVRRAIQRVGVVRFNPFADTGGDQSFAVALLDARGSGVVISSLFSRNSTRVFAKAIVDGKSTYLLTDEEQDAIDQALSTRALSLSKSAN